MSNSRNTVRGSNRADEPRRAKPRSASKGHRTMTTLTYEMFATEWKNKNLAARDLVRKWQVKSPADIGCVLAQNGSMWQLSPDTNEAREAFAGFEVRFREQEDAKAAARNARLGVGTQPEQDTSFTQEDVAAVNEMVAQDEAPPLGELGGEQTTEQPPVEQPPAEQLPADGPQLPAEQPQPEEPQPEPMFGGNAPTPQEEAPTSSGVAPTSSGNEEDPTSSDVEEKPVEGGPIVLDFYGNRAEAFTIATYIARKLKEDVGYTFGGSERTMVEASKPAKAAPLRMEVTNGGVFAASGNHTFSQTALKPVKTKTVPTAQQQRQIDLLIRPQGATTKELYETTTSVVGVPWRDIVYNLAKRFDFMFDSRKDENNRVHYFLSQVVPAEQVVTASPFAQAVAAHQKATLSGGAAAEQPATEQAPAAEQPPATDQETAA